MSPAAAQEATQAPVGGPAGFNRRLYAPMIGGSILNPINSSMVAVSLVPIAAAFGATSAQTAWLVTGLYLATSVGQPVLGRLVDLWGPRPVYLGATALAGLAGLAGALAPSLGVLVAARVVLGLGTCAGYPSAMALIRSEARRTGQETPAQVLSWLALASQSIAVVGPTIGGLLIGVGGWRAVFAVNVPLSLACVALGLVYLPRTPRAATPVRPRGAGAPRLGLDVPGMAAFTVTLVALLLLVSDPRPARAWLGALALVTGVLFVVRELHADEPFIDLRALAARPPLLLTYLRQLAGGLLMYAFLYGFTPWLEAGYGLQASAAGLLLIPMSAAAIVATAVTGRSPFVRGKLLVGGVLQAIGAAGLLVTGEHSPIVWLAVLGLLLGTSQGLVNLANQNAMYAQADPERIASSAGLLRTFAYLGAIAAGTIGGAIYGPAPTTAGLHELAWVMVVIAVVFLGLTAADRSLVRGRTAASTTPTD